MSAEWDLILCEVGVLELQARTGRVWLLFYRIVLGVGGWVLYGGGHAERFGDWLNAERDVPCPALLRSPSLSLSSWTSASSGASWWLVWIWNEPASPAEHQHQEGCQKSKAGFLAWSPALPGALSDACTNWHSLEPWTSSVQGGGTWLFSGPWSPYPGRLE